MIAQSARVNPPMGARARVATGGAKSEAAEKDPPPLRFRRNLSEGTARSRARTERMLLLESGARGHLSREEPLAACAESVKGRTCVGVPCALERMLAPRSRRACVFSREAGFPGKKSRIGSPFAVFKRSSDDESAASHRWAKMIAAASTTTSSCDSAALCPSDNDDAREKPQAEEKKSIRRSAAEARAPRSRDHGRRVRALRG